MFRVNSLTDLNYYLFTLVWSEYGCLEIAISICSGSNGSCLNPIKWALTWLTDLMTLSGLFVMAFLARLADLAAILFWSYAMASNLSSSILWFFH